ncbi:MAG: prepilin peptidase [Pseudomonadota bacterium]
MTSQTILAIFLILIGPAIGSFLGVLVDRLPRGEDIVAQPSRCRSCGTKLSPVDLIPLISFAKNHGRCRHCAAPIPTFTFQTEILGAAAAVLAVLAGGGPVEMFLAAIWLWLLVALAMTDLIWMRLPDPLTLLLFATALAVAALPFGHGWHTAIWGACLGCGSFLALRWGYAALRGQTGLGLGDVKLMAGLGAFAGPLALPHLILIAALAALVAAVLTRSTAVDGLKRDRALPFGAALCAAAALLWLWRAAGISSSGLVV